MVAVEPGVIKSTIGITDTERERWIIGVRGKIIDEVQVVGPEIDAPEGCSLWDSETSRSATRQRGVEAWRNCQGTGEGIVEASHCNSSPYDVDGVVSLVSGVGGLA